MNRNINGGCIFANRATIGCQRSINPIEGPCTCTHKIICKSSVQIAERITKEITIVCLHFIILLFRAYDEELSFGFYI